MQLNIQAPINRLSYGIMSCNIIKEMVKLGTDITLFPVGKTEIPTEIFEDLSGEDKLKIANAASKQSEDFAGKKSLRIYHATDLAPRIGKGRHIGFTAFELDAFTGREKANMAACDKVMTCSEWGYNVLKNNNVKHSCYSPLGVDRSIFNENITSSPANILRDSKEKFIFLHVGKAEKRKSTLEIVEAFNMAFSDKDNVELWMCCYNPFLNKQEEEYWYNKIAGYRDNRLWSKTKLISRPLPTQKDIADIMIQADCGVFLHHSEGWGMPILEMMSCGKDIVVTNYSGSTEFCNKHNSFLIDIDELEEARDDKFFKNSVGKWAKIGLNQIERMSNGMKRTYQRGRNLNINGIETAKQFTWQKTATKILEQFN